MAKIDIIEYMSGMTGYSLDEAVFKRIAIDRDLGDGCFCYTEQISQRTKDLVLADILFTVWISGKNIASFQHQHGQFSTSTGAQYLDKDNIYDTMVALYRKWDDDKLDLIQTTSLEWIHEED